MAEIKKQNGKYSLAFDHLWEAQYLTRNSADEHQHALALIELSRLYTDFNMEEEALLHLQEALKISRELYAENKQDVVNLNGSFMNLAVRERNQGNYQQALDYLDSCRFIYDRSLEMPFLDAEKGLLMMKLKRFDEAEGHLYTARANAEGINPSYMVNIYLYLGELKTALQEPDSAIYYFNRSLDFIEYQHSGRILAPEILKRLANIYYSLGKTADAYRYMQKSKTEADSLIQMKNSTNSELFEIKNTYLKSISEKNEQLERQNTVIKQNRQIQQRLKIILALVLLLGFVLIIVIRMRLILRKTLLEKETNELQAKIEKERSESQLESKSKELTSYALQLIDKDAAINELLEQIKKESPTSFKPLNNKYKKGSKDLWDEFNLRFTEVNSAFYDRLRTKHPNLSVTEQKHCALIKLHFATKEMARILNIETHSVHMSRSRIRKKIGLQRSDSLEDYIAGL